MNEKDRTVLEKRAFGGNPEELARRVEVARDVRIEQIIRGLGIKDEGKKAEMRRKLRRPVPKKYRLLSREQILRGPHP